MPKCFLCSNILHTISLLVVHFKIKHKLHSGDRFGCREDGCLRNFCDLYSFKKHFKKIHHGVSEKCSKNVVHGVADNIESCEIGESTVPENSQRVKIPTINELKLLIKSEVLIFLGKLYNSSVLPRNHIQTIVENVSDLLRGDFVVILKQTITNLLQLDSVTEKTISTISEILDCLINPFCELETEYRRLKAFEDSDKLIHPVEYTVGSQMKGVAKDNMMLLKSVEQTAQFIPLRSVFQNLLEMEGFLSELMNYINFLNNDMTNIKNIIQCAHWKKLKQTTNADLVLPLLLFYDDYESGNALSSHSGIHKLGGVYVSIGCLPPKYSSSLENIFLATLFHSSNRKEFGNFAIFRPLIQELKYLQEIGIKVKTQFTPITVKFILTLILGDNLGLHSILGFVESFSANFHCRFCKIHKNDSQVLSTNSGITLRTVSNYNEDLLVNDVSKTGVKENCVFNTLPTFHAVSNYAVDVMHDLLEGVCHYDLLHVLSYYINCLKLFSLDTLNYRLSIFNFSFEKFNKPPTIFHGFENKNKLNMSASETLCFTRYLPLLVGDLIPEDDDVWKLFLILRNIIDITTSDFTTSQYIAELEWLISEHNRLYLNLFKDTLKPKHHHLLHYAEVMKQIGPVQNISSMRFESKHREAKSTANVTYCRKNITKSLALKHQLKFCFRLMSNKFKDVLIVGPSVYYHDANDSDDNESYPKEFTLHTVVKWVRLSSFEYKLHSMIVVDIINLLPEFGIISKILVNDKREVCFIYKSFKTLCFSEHYHAFEIEATQTTSRVLSIDLPSYLSTVLHSVSPNGKHYAALRHRL